MPPEEARPVAPSLNLGLDSEIPTSLLGAAFALFLMLFIIAWPADAIGEARRLLKPGGRILFLAATNARSEARLRSDFAAWAADASLRLAPPLIVTQDELDEGLGTLERILAEAPKKA